MKLCPNYPLISIDPEARFGRACLVDTRISVGDVLGWLGSGMNMDDIVEEFPELTETAIRACLRYAADRENQARLASS